MYNYFYNFHHKKLAEGLFNQTSSGIFVPKNIPGLVLWLDGNDLNGDGSQMPDNTPISLWADKSGFNNTPTAVTGDAEPVAQIINSKNLVRFDGVQQYLVAANSASLQLTGPMTVVAMAMTNNVDDGVSHRMLSKFDGTHSGGYAYGQIDVLYDLSLYNVFSYETTGSHWSVGQYQASAAVLDSSFDVSFYKNNTFLEKVNNNAAPINTVSDLYIGSVTGTDEFWNGDLLEILLYNRALSTGELTAIYNYLSQKWIDFF